MSQIALPFDWPAPEDSDSFIVTAANRNAVDGIDRSSSWPVRAAILTGPRKSGRSLLGRIFAAKTGGTLIDDGEQHRETEIFHRWNTAQEERKPLLIVAMSPPPYGSPVLTLSCDFGAKPRWASRQCAWRR